MSIKGRIHSFETFGTVDGPGIRFVVFMQGCCLSCIYCHNRDTWSLGSGKEYTSSEVFERIKKYESYITSSNGGVTLSGGEPLLQPEFAKSLFMKCRASGIHTAIDTSGYADIDKVEELIEYTDLILLDIKHADNEMHKKITGKGNEKPREFARFVSEKGKPMWIRYVLLPGYTDGEADLLGASEFIKTLKTVENIEVLPYHSAGAYKWNELFVKYSLSDVDAPTQEQIERAYRILKG